MVSVLFLSNFCVLVDYTDCAYAKIDTSNKALTIIGYVMAGICGVCLLPLLVLIIRWQCWKCRKRRERTGSDSNGLVDYGSWCDYWSLCQEPVISDCRRKIRLKKLVKGQMSQLMRLWYLSHRQPAKAQMSPCIRTVSPEPLLFAHIKYGSRRRGRPKIRHLASLDVCTCTFEEWIYGGRKVP